MGAASARVNGGRESLERERPNDGAQEKLFDDVGEGFQGQADGMTSDWRSAQANSPAAQALAGYQARFVATSQNLKTAINLRKYVNAIPSQVAEEVKTSWAAVQDYALDAIEGISGNSSASPSPWGKLESSLMDDGMKFLKYDKALAQQVGPDPMAQRLFAMSYAVNSMGIAQSIAGTGEKGEEIAEAIGPERARRIEQLGAQYSYTTANAAQNMIGQVDSLMAGPQGYFGQPVTSLTPEVPGAESAARAESPFGPGTPESVTPVGSSRGDSSPSGIPLPEILGGARPESNNGPAGRSTYWYDANAVDIFGDDAQFQVPEFTIPGEAVPMHRGDMVAAVGFDPAFVENQDFVRAASKPGAGRMIQILANAANEEGIDPKLLIAQAYVESRFNPKAVSHAGAQGLMQFMPATAKQYEISDPFDPTQSARAGARYMRNLLDMFDGREDLALSGYNYGENRVLETMSVPTNKETSGYVTSILGLRDTMKQTGGF